MSDAEQRERQKEIITADCATPTDSKSLCDVCGENLRRDDHREDGGNNRSPQNGEETSTTVFTVGSVLRAAAAADLKHLGAGDAFRIRQVRSGHQRAPQRDRIHDTKNSAERADPKRGPERKF